MITERQLRMDNHNTIGVPPKQTPLIHQSVVQEIFRLCNMLATHYPKGRVMVIIQHPDCPENIEAEPADSSAFFKKSDRLDRLIDSLRLDDTGGSYADYGFGTQVEVPGGASISLSAIQPERDYDYKGREAESLTKREKEILELVAGGQTNKKISCICGISEQTVKCHVSSILHKLHANDRAHSVALALSSGLI